MADLIHSRLKATTRANTRMANVMGAVISQNWYWVHCVLRMSYTFIPVFLFSIYGRQ